MRISRNTFWISMIITLITLIISVILSFRIEENQITIFICNIAENIFAGTIVLLITSLYEYIVHRKETLENLLLEINHIKNLFNKLKYFDHRDFVTKEKYIEYYKDQFTEDEINRLYEKEKNKQLEKQKNDFEKIIDGYIEIANENYDLFWNKYRDICFLFDFKHKTRNKIYNELFSYIYYEKISKIRDETFHFIEYKKSKNGNYVVNKDKLIKLQDEIFYFEEKKFLENGSREEFDVDRTKIDICGWGDDYISQTYYIYGNIVTKHLENFYNYIWKLTYKNSNKEE